MLIEEVQNLKYEDDLFDRDLALTGELGGVLEVENEVNLKEICKDVGFEALPSPNVISKWS